MAQMAETITLHDQGRGGNELHLNTRWLMSWNGRGAVVGMSLGTQILMAMELMGAQKSHVVRESPEEIMALLYPDQEG